VQGKERDIIVKIEVYKQGNEAWNVIYFAYKVEGENEWTVVLEE
jgi:hypothetical protein